MCAKPRAAPPPSTSAILGFGLSVMGGPCVDAQEASNIANVTIARTIFVFFGIIFLNEIRTLPRRHGVAETPSLKSEG